MKLFIITALLAFTASLSAEVGDIPVPGDYRGLGTPQAARYTPGYAGRWTIESGIQLPGSSTPAPIILYWGTWDDVPLDACDWDGDGKADPTVYRPATDQIFVLRSSCMGGAYTCYEVF